MTNTTSPKRGWRGVGILVSFALLLALGFGTYVVAQQQQAVRISRIEELTADRIAAELLKTLAVGSEENLGGIINIGQRDFPDGISVDSREIIDANGRHIGSDVYQALSWPATSTPDTYSRLVVYDPPDDIDVIVEDMYLDITTAVASMAGGYMCGTTTVAATDSAGNVYLTATNTETLMHTVSTTALFTGRDGVQGLLSPRHHPGTNWGNFKASYSWRETVGAPTTTDFILRATQSEVISCVYYPPASASTTDFTATGGFTGAGALHVTTKKR